jgi:predicted lipoprotein with Yx(FWY)xxD motif
VIRKTYAFALLAIAAALIVAGCGGGSSTSSSGYGGAGENSASESETKSSKGGAYAPPSEETTANSGAEGAAMVSVANAGDVGMVLVDSKGFTVYDFGKDKGTASSCYGACAEFWPPLLTEGEPEVGKGASASMLGTTKRKDGTTQVTYAGHPLYTYVEDSKPGEATGNDLDIFGGEWYALTSSGEEPKG